ncbi:UvrD-helicase domain-containing protein [Desulfonauticus submarinus]
MVVEEEICKQNPRNYFRGKKLVDYQNLDFPFILKIKASAGAGKTYQLMIAYLWLLSKQKHVSLDSLKSIVALTFTNQATF